MITNQEIEHNIPYLLMGLGIGLVLYVMCRIIKILITKEINQKDEEFLAILIFVIIVPPIYVYSWTNRIIRQCKYRNKK